MSINSDLNYDVVQAMLSRDKEDNPAQTRELFDVLLNFHEALKPLVKQSRQRSRRFVKKESTATQQNGTAASSH